jgi:hypothetical protein
MANGNNKEAKSGNNPSKGDGPGPSDNTAKSGSKPGGTQAGATGPGGNGPHVEPTPQDPSTAFAKKQGELQLEKLKERMTPEMLKKMNWSEDDWRQFLKEAKAYQELQRRQQATSNNAFQRGITHDLPSAPVREVDLNKSDQIDPLSVDRAQPPPEFRDAQRQFTATPGGKK